MEKNHWSRDDWLKSYETGVWVFLIVVVAAFLGLILWMGYAILLRGRPPEADAPTRPLKSVLAALASASQRFEVLFHQLHDERFVVGVTPTIAVDATDQHLTVVVDFH
jgi:hypothetical protein